MKRRQSYPHREALPSKSSGFCSSPVLGIALSILVICGWTPSGSTAELPLRVYRAQPLPGDLFTGRDIRIDEHGNIFAAGFGRPTPFFIYRAGRDHGKPPGVQTITAPITPNRGEFSIVDINDKGQFVCTESSTGFDHRFVWTGGGFAELQPPPPYDQTPPIPGFPNLYFSDGLAPTAILNNGIIWGTANSISNGFATPGDYGGEVRWSSGGIPQVTFPFRSSTDPLGSGIGPNELGQFLRFSALSFGNGYTDFGYWDGSSGGASPIVGLPISSSVTMNDRSTIAGVDAATHQAWIYSPSGTVGLSPGFHLLGGDAVGDRLLLSNSDELFVGTENPSAPFQVYRRGRWNRLVAKDATGQDAGLFSFTSVNGLGSMIALAGAHDIGGATTATGFFLLTPEDLSVAISVTPTTLSLGEEFDLKLDIFNHSDQVMNGVGILVSSLYFTGAIIADWIKAPPTLLKLSPGQGGTLHYGFRVKAPGKAQVRFQVEGLSTSGTRVALTEGLASPVITAKSGVHGDLLVKLLSEPDSAFGMDDSYQEVPAGAQFRTNEVSAKTVSQFVVQIQNDDSRPRTYLLAGKETGIEGWKSQYWFENQDISAALRTTRGFQFPELPTNSSFQIRVEMTFTNPVPTFPLQTILTLSSTNAPTEVLDSVECLSMLPRVEVRALEVNQTVQDWKNTIRLIADKQTLARAFFARPTHSVFEGTIRARLRGYRGGVELSGSPIDSREEDAVLRPDPVPYRRSLEEGLSFDLPRDWVEGTLVLKLEPLDFTPVYKEPAEPGGQAADGVIAKSFINMPPLPIYFHKVTERMATGATVSTTDSDIAEMILHIRAAFPIAEVRWLEGFSPSIASKELLDVHDFAKVNTLIKSDLQYLLCPLLQVCPLHQALLPFVPAPISDGGGSQGGGRADAIPSVISTARVQNALTYAPGSVHELAHCLGRYHSVSRAFPTTIYDGEIYLQGLCNEIAATNAPNFPYFYQLNDRLLATLGPMDSGPDNEVWGFDSASDVIVDPEQIPELMSYCRLRGEWPSKFTYEGLLGTIQSRWGSLEAAPLPPIRLAASDAQPMLLLRGNVELSTATVSIAPMRVVTLPVESQLPEPGEYQLELLDSRGQVLRAYPFKPTGSIDLPLDGSFLFLVPMDSELGAIRVRHLDRILLERTASPHAPKVRVISPNGGETLDSPDITLRWETQDDDQDAIFSTVEYSFDNGETWTTLAVDLTTNTCVVSRALMKGSPAARIRVTVSDGLLSGFDQSDNAFTVVDNPPKLILLQPRAEGPYAGHQRIYFSAAYMDPEDGTIPADRIHWSSNRDGELGVGLNLDKLASAFSPGLHTIHVTATDSTGHSASASTSITILPNTPARLTDLQWTKEGQLQFLLRGVAGTTNDILTSSDLSHWIPVSTRIMTNSTERVSLKIPGSSEPWFLRTLTQ